MRKMLTVCLLCWITATAALADSPATVAQNPILPGFHPDPTICRVDSDYYICNSSFTWFPGLPIYRSRDLANWQLVGHAIDRSGMVSLEGVRDKDGVWAPTLRHHDGRFYLFCNVSNRGNFFISAERPEGPWSDPVWIKDAAGIDPDIFWDTDGQSYMLANQWGLKDLKYQGRCVIWIQQIDLNTGRLQGQRHYLTMGHAANAKSTEGAHLYRVGNRYALLTAEGGTDFNHAVTVHWSDHLLGPYQPQQANPVLTHRHLGHDAPVQCVGHADLVQTPSGQWFAVCLGKRMIDGCYSFTRETFLCPVFLQQGEFVFNPGQGMLPEKVACPAVPSAPVAGEPVQWYCERIPPAQFYSREGNRFTLQLLPATLDSLTSPALLMRKVASHQFSFTTTVEFSAKRNNEEAGIVLHRNAGAYVALLKTRDSLRLVCRRKGDTQTLMSIPYSRRQVVMRLEADGLTATLYYGDDASSLRQLSEVSLIPLADDGKLNRFNGLGIGFYATANGLKSHQKAVFTMLPDAGSREHLWQSFLTPPDSIRVGCYYYWVNECVDAKGIKADLRWMKDNGITLAFLATDIRNRTRWNNPWEGQTFGSNKFLSRQWWKNLRTALKTAGQLGIEMGLFNAPGWSQSGGPWVKPEEAMRNWTPQGIEVCKDARGNEVVCGPCSPEAEGLEVDKLSKAHVQKHFDAFIGEILRRIPAKDRPTLTTVVVDSWERGKQNYTDSIFDKFRRRYGYELDYANPDSKKDLERLISDLVASEYMGGLTEKAHEYGLRTWCEPYAHSPFPGNSITYGGAADEVAAEFWVNDRKFRQKEVDAALSAARKSGKNRVWAESFTDGAWDKPAQDDWSLAKLKSIADRYFHAGINANILHVMISQPGDEDKPVVRPWFGTYFDRRSQHAADLKPLVAYLRRCNFMLQLGKPHNNAPDCRIMANGTVIRFTDEALFEVTFPDGRKELWNPMHGLTPDIASANIPAK